MPADPGPDGTHATLVAVAGVVGLERTLDAERSPVLGGGVPLADGAELPLRAATVQLSEHDECLVGELGAEVEANDLLARLLVEDADERVAYRSEPLPTLLRSPDDDREDDPRDVVGDLVEVDLDQLVVTVALARAVVPHEDDGLTRGLAVVGVDEPLLVTVVGRVHRRRNPAGLVESGRGQVEVVVRLATIQVDVPTAGNDSSSQGRSSLDQRDVAAFLQSHTHAVNQLPVESLWP